MQSHKQSNQLSKLLSQASVPAATPGRRPTMSDLNSSSIDVASWLQVDKYGLHIDKSSEALEDLEVEIDLTEIIPVYMVRYGKNPPQYNKSYDGATTFGSPKPWEVTLREAQQHDPDCKGQYSSVEIPMTLLDDVPLKRDKKTIEGQTRVTLDACRHGGMTELEEAELTEGQGMILSGHKTPQAYRGYAKKTLARAMGATMKRWAWKQAQNKFRNGPPDGFRNANSKQVISTWKVSTKGP